MCFYITGALPFATQQADAFLFFISVTSAYVPAYIHISIQRNMEAHAHMLIIGATSLTNAGLSSVLGCSIMYANVFCADYKSLRLGRVKELWGGDGKEYI